MSLPMSSRNALTFGHLVKSDRGGVARRSCATPLLYRAWKPSLQEGYFGTHPFARAFVLVAPRPAGVPSITSVTVGAGAPRRAAYTGNHSVAFAGSSSTM